MGIGWDSPAIMFKKKEGHYRPLSLLSRSLIRL